MCMHLRSKNDLEKRPALSSIHMAASDYIARAWASARAAEAARASEVSTPTVLLKLS